jgi:hypothetical protein
MSDDRAGVASIGWGGDQLVTDFRAAHLFDGPMGRAGPWRQHGRSFSARIGQTAADGGPPGGVSSHD